MKRATRADAVVGFGMMRRRLQIVFARANYATRPTRCIQFKSRLTWPVFYFHRCLLTFSLLLLVYRKCYLRSINIIIVSLASDLELRLCKTSPKCAKKLQAKGLQTVKPVANSPSGGSCSVAVAVALGVAIFAI